MGYAMGYATGTGTLDFENSRSVSGFFLMDLSIES